MMRAVVCGVLLSAVGVGRADDNPLGLPVPNDPDRPGAVMLHGGGRITDDAFERFVELAGGRNARIVLVPSAGYRAASYPTRRDFMDALSRRFGSWVRLASDGRVADFTFLATDDPADADDPEFVRPLLNATGVWFSGGAQSRLNYRYVGNFPQRTRFQQALREVLARGGVVGGTSAGMAALPEVMTLSQDRRRGAGPLSAVAAHGLGVFDGAIVEQHFDGRNGRMERFFELLRDSDRLDRLTGRRGAGARMMGLAVEEATALVIRGGRIEVLGAGEAHVFIKGSDGRTLNWHALRSGDRAALERDGQDNRLVVGGK